MFLLDDILLAPLNGVIWIGKKVNDIMEKEMSDEGLVKEELMRAQLRFEMDEINEKEYNVLEKELLERLDAIRESKGLT